MSNTLTRSGISNWANILVRPTDSIMSGMETIDASGRQICIVVDENRKLLGTLTDGDIRRAVLRGFDLQEGKIEEVMNHDPYFVRPNESSAALMETLRQRRIRLVPVIDEDRIVINLVALDESLLSKPHHDNLVVIMAGGLGTRLRPLTDELPKPLLRVGDKPLLETIIENFLRHNFTKFCICLNYKGQLISDHFGDGSKFGADISYVTEETKMGTAGAMALISPPPSEPMIVMNGDLLTQVNFESLLDFHSQEGAAATMCIREYDLQVPFGVIEVDDRRIVSIDEKPIQQFYVNAGIYVLDPSVLSLLPDSQPADMTMLFERIISEGQEAAVFPIREYWVDVGRLDDLERAQREYSAIFGS